MTVWTHTQGAIPTAKHRRDACACHNKRSPVIPCRGSGCYGHNGADDALDAALIARAMRAVPGRVRGCATRNMAGSRMARRW